MANAYISYRSAWFQTQFNDADAALDVAARTGAVSSGYARTEQDRLTVYRAIETSRLQLLEAARPPTETTTVSPWRAAVVTGACALTLALAASAIQSGRARGALFAVH